MQKRLNDLRNPAQSSPAHGGLAASPAQSAQGSTNSSRVIHPTRFESLRDKARNAIWAAASDRSFIQFFENRVPIAGGNLLHLLAQDEKNPNTSSALIIGTCGGWLSARVDSAISSFLYWKGHYEQACFFPCALRTGFHHSLGFCPLLQRLFDSALCGFFNSCSQP